MEVRVDVDVPGGAGLGCSAAIGVAIVRAMAEASDVALDDASTQAHALAWERVFHGNPSGVDVAAATLGGVLAFRRGAPIDRVRPASPMEIAIARRPQVVERTFDGIDTLAKKGIVAIEHGKWREVGQLMDLNHALLSSLMVSTERIEQACSIARNAGAAGAKLTGAGGGGCAIALAPGCSQAIVEAWKAAGIEGFVTTIGASAMVTPPPTPKSEVHA
jgi:mevalonate kinase